MIRRNLAFKEDIPADALRQRRDMYVLAIGLLIFNVAGGSISAESTSGILSVHLLHPWVVLVAAWVGFLYFWWRFWLVSRARPFVDFVSAINWQLGNLPAVREIASSYVEPGTSAWSIEEAKKQILLPGGAVPKVDIRTTKISLNSLRDQAGGTFVGNFGSNAIEIPPELLRRYRRAKLLAIYRAITCERIFTDYTLPHLFAMLTAAVGACRYAAILKAMIQS